LQQICILWKKSHKIVTTYKTRIFLRLLEVGRAPGYKLSYLYSDGGLQVLVSLASVAYVTTSCKWIMRIRSFCRKFSFLINAVYGCHFSSVCRSVGRSLSFFLFTLTVVITLLLRCCDYAALSMRICYKWAPFCINLVTAIVILLHREHDVI